jgi:hypothetical protein
VLIANTSGIINSAVNCSKRPQIKSGFQALLLYHKADTSYWRGTSLGRIVRYRRKPLETDTLRIPPLMSGVCYNLWKQQAFIIRRYLSCPANQLFIIYHVPTNYHNSNNRSRDRMLWRRYVGEWDPCRTAYIYGGEQQGTLKSNFAGFRH